LDIQKHEARDLPNARERFTLKRRHGPRLCPARSGISRSASDSQAVLSISDVIIPARLLRLVCDTAAVRARGLQPASASTPAQASNDFARLGWRELKRRKRRALGLLNACHAIARFSIVLATILAVAGCSKESAPKAGPSAPKVTGDEVEFAAGSPQLDSIAVAAAQARTVAVRHVTGRLYWDDDTTVRIYTPAAGRVTKVLADIGDVVAAGAPLAELDSPDYAQALATARTAVGNLMAADKALERTKALLSHGAYAQKDLEAAEAAYITALAERDRAKAVLLNFGGGDQIYSELERALATDRSEAAADNYAGRTNRLTSQYVVRSPLAGVVVDKNINPGQELRADMMLGNVPQTYNTLFTVSDPTKLWLQVDVAEEDMRVLEVGQRLLVHSSVFPEKTFDGTVEKVGDTLDPSTRTVKVRGVVANPDNLLKAEMYVTVDLVVALDKIANAGVEIPASSVFMLDDQNYLFVEIGPGHFKRQEVKVGTEADGVIPVFAGVTAGQKVVTGGALLLQSIVNPAN
jgi:cobalt-zinc-cadmium efflux system membrane fusion protein